MTFRLPYPASVTLPSLCDVGVGSPLVLLHGMGAHWPVWRPVLPALQARHRVIALNLPGHRGGAAMPRPDRPTIADMTEVLLQQLRDLGLSSAHVAGNSLGGWLALELHRRGFARSVTAFSPAGAGQTQADINAVARSARWGHAMARQLPTFLDLSLRSDRLRRLLLAQTMAHPERLSLNDVRDLIAALRGADVLPGLIDDVQRHGGLQPLAASAIPICVAWGASDRVLPFDAHGRPLLQRVPGAVGVTVPDAGHVPMLDNPQRVAELVLATCAQGDTLSTDTPAQTGEVP